MWKAVLFDLDGTLTDSAEGITKSVQYALDAYGIHVDDYRDLRCFVGPPLHAQFEKYAGWTPEQSNIAVDKFRERFSTVGIYENHLYPDVENMLIQLRNQGILLGVASSKPEVFVNRVLEYFHIRQYFHVVVGSELDGSREKKHDVIELALLKMGMSQNRDEVIMVGDRDADVIGAKQSGLTCLGAAYGYGGSVELLTAGADYLVHSVEEMMQFFVENPPIRTYVQKQKKDGMFHKVWRILYPMGIHFGALNLISLIGGVILSFIGISIMGLSDTEALTDYVMGGTLTMTGIAEICAIPFLTYFFKKDALIRNNRPMRPIITRLKNVPIGFAVFIFFFSAVFGDFLGNVISLSGLPNLFPYYAELSEQIYTNQNLVWMIVAVGILGPIAEELVFRGLIYKRAKDYWGAKAGIVISAMLFGIYHGNMIQFIFAAILGLFFAYLYERTDTLWVPVLCHMGVNCMSCVLSELVTYNNGFVFLAVVAVEAISCAAGGWYLYKKFHRA